MSIFKIFKNSAGFTLIEAMVAASVIGVISMVVMNQVNLANKARVSSSSSSVVNTLRDKLIIALSNEQTCTANFGGDPVALTTHLVVSDSEALDIVRTATNYGLDVAGSVSSDTNTESVRVQSIDTYENLSNSDELILRVRFQKKSGLAGVFSIREEFTMPLNLIKSGGNVGRCFSDATLSVATVIRMSCKGNTAYYNPARNVPFGQCENMFSQPRALPAATPPRPAYPNGCPNGFFMRKVGVNLYGAAANTTDSKTIQYECTPLKSACPAGQVLKSTNADGTVTCGYPLPTCGPGQLMVMSAAGNFICLATDTGCSGLYAIKRFNADGSVTCAPFYPPSTCSGLFITSITPGSVSCSANVQAIVCPFGSFVKSFNAAGTPICSPWLQLGFTCPAGQAAVGMFANGSLDCRNMDKYLSCGGAKSAAKTFRDCDAAGGTVIDRFNLTGTNSYCKFTFPASAPAAKTCATVGAGWATCSNLKTTVNNSCTDTNSACAHSDTRGVLVAAGTYAFNGAGIASTQCYHWARNSGPWVRSCTQMITAPVTNAYVTELGCY